MFQYDRGRRYRQVDSNAHGCCRSSCRSTIGTSECSGQATGWVSLECCTGCRARQPAWPGRCAGCGRKETKNPHAYRKRLNCAVSSCPELFPEFALRFCLGWTDGSSRRLWSACLANANTVKMLTPSHPFRLKHRPSGRRCSRLQYRQWVGATIRRRVEQANFLKTVPLFARMPAKKLGRLVDALTTKVPRPHCTAVFRCIASVLSLLLARPRASPRRRQLPPLEQLSPRTTRWVK